MKKVWWLSSLFCILLLSACDLGSSPQTDSVSSHIDAQIVGNEREIMLNVLASLPPEHRDNVVHLAEDGTVYVNRPELRDQFELLKPSEDNDEVFFDSLGRFYIIPDDTPDTELSTQQIECTGNTGAFRRVLTSPGVQSLWAPNRYAYMDADIVLPPVSQVFIEDLGNDKPFIMMGGWGPNLVSAIDAGLQFDRRIRDGILLEDWALFIKAPGGRVAGPRLVPNQQTRMWFYVLSNNQVAVRISGIFSVQEQPLVCDPSTEPYCDPAETIPLPPTPGQAYTISASASGWKADGRGNRLKRTTSMAQLNQTNASNSYVRDIGWWYVRLGSNVTFLSNGAVSAANLHYWGQFNGDTDPSLGICNRPEEAILVDDFLPYLEDVTIDLSLVDE